MQIRTVESGRGAGWLLDGFDYFKRDALTWIGIVIVYFVIVYVADRLPLGIGSLAYVIAAPMFTAGLMLGCKAQDGGGKIEFRHLFAGFSANVGELALIGVATFAGFITLAIIAVLGMVALGAGIGQTFSALESGNVMQTGANLALFLIPLLIAFGASVPLAMALWFAPALVVLGNQSAVQALKLSFNGCLANIVPFLVYGVVGLLLAIAATIPFGLGWLVLVPMITASVYIGYKEIFADSVAAPQA